MKKTSSVSSSGLSSVGCTGLPGCMLTIVFVTLKLLGKITWSWWWVLAPVWGSAIIVAISVVIALVATAILIDKR
jgi:hypothetical protein